MARTEGQWKKGTTSVTPTTDLPILLQNDYLNFGGVNAGDLGYGLRDNNGVIEYKNAAGIWTPIETPANTDVWGSITGTLSDQTDLQSALNAKANALGEDDNYVTDAEKIVIGNTSGTNTGDQTIKDKFGVTVDGGVVVLTTGTKGYSYIEQDCIITGWHVQANASGSVVFDVKRSGASIAGSEKPTLSTQQTNQDLSLTSWTTSLTAGDIIEFVIDSASTITRATLTILITKI